MKKIVLMVVILTLFVASYSFAACAQTANTTTFTCDASTPTWTVNVSNKVFVDYEVEATNFRYYTVATGHNSGDKIYAASQADTKIFYAIDTEILASDVETAAVAATQASPYNGTSGWTAM